MKVVRGWVSCPRLGLAMSCPLPLPKITVTLSPAGAGLGEGAGQAEKSPVTSRQPPVAQLASPALIHTHILTSSVQCPAGFLINPRTLGSNIQHFVLGGPLFILGSVLPCTCDCTGYIGKMSPQQM